MSTPADRLASRQDSLVARWQLIGEHATGTEPMTTDAIDWWARDLRRVFDGVYITGHGAVRREQRWRAGTLTAPETVLSHASAAALWECWNDPPRVVVTRPGSRGIARGIWLDVHYSTTVQDHVTMRNGIRVTTPERTIIDLWPRLSGRGRAKLVRENLRIGRTTAGALVAVLDAHRGRRGLATLRTTTEELARLPIARCKSDAEAYALTLLDAAGIEIPVVNEVIAGGEADFCWPDLMRILEIDGPQWHRFKDEDARKTARWRAAGFSVDRVPSGVVFDDPDAFLALAPPPRRRGARG